MEVEQPPAAQPAQPPKMTNNAPTSLTQPVLLSQPELKLQFGLLNATRRRINVTVNPALLPRVWIKEYQVMVNCLGGLIAPAITQEDYVRMSRTILLRRLQDIVEYQTGVRPDNAIRMARSLETPQPLAELLFALGPYFADVNGRQYNLVYAPAPPQNPPPWYTLDPAILGNYRPLIDQVKHRFRTASFPKSNDINGQPLMFTVGREQNGMKSVRASNNVPKPSDGFLRFVHEEFFADNVPNYDDCDLIMTNTLFISDVVDAYV